MNNRPIYMDYMATTPIDPRVIEQMFHYMGPDGHFGNPASATHGYGRDAAVAVELAREQIATTVGASPDDIVFTSGATEANNLAILGAGRFYQRKGRHIITMSTEHMSVLDSARELSSEGFEVTYLDPGKDGLIPLPSLANALRDDTVLVSIMHVNNEIGVVQDIAAIGAMLHGLGIIFHVDAAQSVGRLPIDLHALSVDLMSFSAHKNYGPKGVGALYVRHKPRIRLRPQSFGGGHERGLRSGTIPTHQVIGMGAAFVLGEKERALEQERLLGLRCKLWDGIRHIPGIHLNGSLEHRIAGNLNMSFEGLEGDALLIALSELALSSTSACSSASGAPSHVLKALGLNNALAHSAIRLSLGRFTTMADVQKAIEVISKQLPELQRLAL